MKSTLIQMKHGNEYYLLGQLMVCVELIAAMEELRTSVSPEISLLRKETKGPQSVTTATEIECRSL